VLILIVSHLDWVSGHLLALTEKNVLTWINCQRNREGGG